MSKPTNELIGEWQSKLTGFEASDFADLPLEKALEEVSRWYASSIVAEQMAVLTLARAFEEHGLTQQGVSRYYSCSEAKQSALGRLCYVYGIGELSFKVKNAFLPLLHSLGYRPSVRDDVGRAILKLCNHPNLASSGITPGQVADTLILKCYSPSQSLRLLRSMMAFAESQPEAVPMLLNSLKAACKAAVTTIAGTADISEKAEELERNEGEDAS